MNCKRKRLNKALSMLGVCSRRDADKLITAGEVIVNGTVVNELGISVEDGCKIVVHGAEYSFVGSNTMTKVWSYYKPNGLIVTHRDNSGRRTVFDDLRDKISERVISVGRLDLNSEGLLLLTNCGEFARKAESPKEAWERHYKVRVFGNLDKNVTNQLQRGLTINGMRYKPMIVSYLGRRNERTDNAVVPANQWIKCILREGKNREIRKIFEHFGIKVNRLIRYKFGPYELGTLNPGEVELSDPNL
jgi:23S rRNA pseudouridine2605 synthase